MGELVYSAETHQMLMDFVGALDRLVELGVVGQRIDALKNDWEMEIDAELLREHLGWFAYNQPKTDDDSDFAYLWRKRSDSFVYPLEGARALDDKYHASLMERVLDWADSTQQLIYQKQTHHTEGDR